MNTLTPLVPPALLTARVVTLPDRELERSLDDQSCLSRPRLRKDSHSTGSPESALAEEWVVQRERRDKRRCTYELRTCRTEIAASLVSLKDPSRQRLLLDRRERTGTRNGR